MRGLVGRSRRFLFERTRPLYVSGCVAGVLLVFGFHAVLALPPPDFSKFIAVGDSFFAGISDGGLVQSRQLYSVPALVHPLVGAGGTFEQPLVSEPGIPGLLQLQSIQPPLIAPAPGTGSPLNGALPRSFDNLSVPGFDVADTLSTATGTLLIDLILRGLGTSAAQAVSLSPTQALVWIGNNDALSAVTSGVVIEGVTLTPAAAFETSLQNLVSQLTGAGAQVLLVPIPDWTELPFATHWPTSVFDLTTGELILESGNPVPLIGPGGPLGPGDRLLLPALPLLQQGFGIPVAQGGNGQPLSDFAVLDAAELSAIRLRIQAFNQSIATVASNNGAAVLDEVKDLVDNQLPAGISLGALTILPDFLSGGFYSLDGVHPTVTGYALIADAVISGINRAYGTSFPGVTIPLPEFGLQLIGTGGGTVETVPPGLSCSDDCTGLFQGGTEVQLVARAGAGQRFVGWEGDPDCQDGRVTLDGARVCRAVFAEVAPVPTLSQFGIGLLALLLLGAGLVKLRAG